MTDDQNKEFQGLLTELKEVPASITALKADLARQGEQLDEVRRGFASRTAAPAAARPRHDVSEGCARAVAAQFIALCEKSGYMDALASRPNERDALTRFALGELGISTRAALGTSDIPLPSTFGHEIRELISDFGVVRKAMTHYPITSGTCRPARMGARPSFGSIAMSAPMTEKSPGLEFASLESHKVGGIVRVPRELDEQSAVPMGRFLARYGAIEFARAEDHWAFNADGGASFEGVKGLCKVAGDAECLLTTAAGKTKPSDVTLGDMCALRRLVNKGALNGRLSAYYLDSTWESVLPTWNVANQPMFYQRLPDGRALLDGYPVIWTDVLQPYDTAAAAGKFLAVFGALSFWWFGEHGSPRVDSSEHVWFANDQLGVRFIEEIDFDYMATDATAALQLAAA